MSNYSKLKPCSHCGQHDFEVRLSVNRDGRSCFPYFCKVCNNRSPIVESKLVAFSMGFQDLAL
jgi:hypothetical protein